MAEALLEVRDVSKRFGGFAALNAVFLDVKAGDRVGLIGPNGAGKSTFVNCLCGALYSDSGAIRFNGRDVTRLSTHERTWLGMARSFQLPRPFRSMSVIDNLRLAVVFTARARGGDHPKPREVDRRCHELLDMVGLGNMADRSPHVLSQVELRKLELARAMATGPKLLVADEAMAGLSLSEIEDIVDLLIRFNESGVTIILIEHIMHAVMAFSRRLIVFVSGQKVADGDPETVIRDPDVESAYLGQQAERNASWPEA